MDLYGIFNRDVRTGEAFVETLFANEACNSNHDNQQTKENDGICTPSVRVSTSAFSDDVRPESTAGPESVTDAQPSTSGKSLRVRGGKAAQPKKIAADYDSDDGRIIELKQMGYSDEYVATKLKEEGRVRYVPKSVNTRWLRLRKALEVKGDEELDDELSDWHIGEDGLLHDCVQDAETKIEMEVQRIRERKWNMVATSFAKSIQSRKYTAKACKERYNAVETGTALLPIEIDPDQQGRAKMREDRIAAAKASRAEALEEIKHAQEAITRAATEKQTAMNRKADEKEAEKASRARERAEIAEIRKQSVVERRKHRERVILIQKYYTIAAKWEGQKRRAEIAILDRMVGRSKTQRRALNKQIRLSAAGGVDANDDQGSESDISGLSDLISDDEPVRVSSRTKAVVERPELRRASPAASSHAADTVAPGMSAVTVSTLENPRSVMAMDELDLLLMKRGLLRRTSDETHPQLVARLAETDSQLPNAHLNDLLRVAFLPITGQKADKVRRLQRHDAEQSESGKEGMKATDEAFKGEYAGYTLYKHLVV